MNTPNKLTVLRMLLVPIFLAVLLTSNIPHNYLIAGIIFGMAAVTDLLDGRLARKNQQVTDFGKFVDPLADKLLVTSALIAFVELGFTNSWVVTAIIAREFIVTTLRLVAVDNGVVISANIWGKAKTVFQTIGIAIILLVKELDLVGLMPYYIDVTFGIKLLLYVIMGVTIISGADYIWKYRDYIKTAK